MLQGLFGFVAYDLPKPGGIIEKGVLKVRQQFPGLNIHYTLDGKVPTSKDPQFTEPLTVPESAPVTLRVFDFEGRGGNSIKIN